MDAHNSEIAASLGVKQAGEDQNRKTQRQARRLAQRKETRQAQT
jgi:hypothetical protein